MPVTTNKEANIANPTPTIAFMTTPLDADFGSSGAAILPVCGVESNKKQMRRRQHRRRRCLCFAQ
jgi:hypothetical protein